MAWGGRDQRSVWRGRTRRWSILTPAVFAARLRAPVGASPPLHAPARINQNHKPKLSWHLDQETGASHWLKSRKKESPI